MRILALVLFLTLGMALAGPDGLYFAQENRIENGKIRLVETLIRVPIGGIGLLDTALAKEARPARAAQISYNNEQKTWFITDQVGHFFAPKRAKELYRVALEAGLTEFFLPVSYIPPSYGVKRYYDLGIRDMLSEATTRFGGSSRERAYNIALGASRLNGYMVAPGQIFSFAQAMGEVSEATGFKKAFVISGEQTVEGVGGGMCQVSTTTFRAAYFAGLPIVQRRPHSYQVRYYSPTGLDAAVFLPSLDLKFKNDTPGNILIQTSVRGTSLTFRIFGTKDRTTTWSDPLTLSRTPARPTRFIADPSLARQQFQQVDFSADGATVMVYRTVKFSDGRVVKDTLKSTYKPWGAVWLVGPGTKLRGGREIWPETDDIAGNNTYKLPTQTR